MQMRFRHPRKSHAPEVIESADRRNCDTKLRFRFDLVHILSARPAGTRIRKMQRRWQHPRQWTQ